MVECMTTNYDALAKSQPADLHGNPAENVNSENILPKHLECLR